MKFISGKICILSLALLVLLGTGFSVNSIPYIHTGKNQMVYDYVLSRYNKGHLTVNQTQQQQSNAKKMSLPANTEGSLNWAGYIVTPTSNKSYTSVSGSWTVPNISAAQQNAVAAQWIGLGGVSTNDLLQAGTIEQIKNGQAVAEVFWEQLPSVAQNIMSVPVGSTINMSIYKLSDSSSTWNIKFTAKFPNGQTQTKTIPVTIDSSYEKAIGTSAEWISEDPSNENNQLYPLANMGTVNFQYALANGQPLNSSSNTVHPVALISNNGIVRIAPSAIGKDGESFSTNMISTNTGTESIPGYRQRRYPGTQRSMNWGIRERGSFGHGWQWVIIFQIN